MGKVYVMNKEELVSIGMPVYNDKAFLELALDSLLRQTWSNIELIISDDCSTDGSQAICRQYAAADQRIKYIRQPENIGISRNMEFLLHEAKGKYFMWAANDDEWDPEFISVLADGLQRTPDAVVAFSNVADIDEQGRVFNIHDPKKIDYSGSNPEERIRKLIRVFYDGFGYGLFVRESILGVRFPVWWWVNKTCAYNNIYPTLCFYLTRGNYVQCGDRPLWRNRFKNAGHVNHKVPYPNNYIRGNFAHLLRRFNLVTRSLGSIRNAGGKTALVAGVFFPMFRLWFLKPVYYELIGTSKKLIKGEIKFW
ncbi:MAG TPA: glycosyltransferase family 2 protein [Puia sp.]|nr:glycosyltransferase family 2 protein [Puia sp.]